MKYPRNFAIALLAFLAVVDAQRQDKQDKNQDEDALMTSDPTSQPSFAPTLFDDIVLFDDVIDSNSTEPSESPTLLPTDSISSAPTTIATEAEDCAGQTCDVGDRDACTCRSGLECRQRGIGLFICSQKSRTERKRLSAEAGIGGAAGRDRRARTPGRVRG